MNKKQQVVALTLAITLLLSGCSGLTIGSSEKQEQNTQQSLNVGQSTARKKKQKRRRKSLSATKKSRPRWKVRVYLIAHYQELGQGKPAIPVSDGDG